eukprot:COSAG01_NODE_30315_length_618_cov_1.200385_1_plen_70_part_01
MHPGSGGAPWLAAVTAVVARDACVRACVRACSVEGPAGVRYPPTHKLYFDEMQRLECEGAVLAVGSGEEK